ncbi:MAG: mevalonate kinase [Candidatus Diapherotrites archaeon]
MKNAQGIGYGKAILFGEHFVVYGLPGIVSAIDLNTTCTFKKNPKGVKGIISNDLVTGEKIVYGRAPYKNLDKVIKVILEKTGIKEDDFTLELKTNMSLKGGMGSSAALCVSITKCLNEQFKLNLTLEQVNKIAYEAEKVFHATPSGIDNTASTYGGLLWFMKKDNKTQIEKIQIKKSIEAILADTGIMRDTGEVVKMVKEQKEKNKEKYKTIFEKYEKIAKQAKQSIEEENWERVCELMQENQELLREIGVSSQENEKLISIALASGAKAAKITGAGLGGNIIAITPGKELQEKVAKAFQKKGYKAYKIKIGKMKK